eukprot:TRINITY_DN33674_c0_g1_i1.p4 TRINITY_DN33674_c0_g1~~TRINITY_DN33674_c0_g1_i1.p4  ORF type:complete len:62 (-),score=2.05 TRINITY_DN33674_c0_g1_i1:52-237(-)
MLSEGAEELGLACPILIEVRWELHEVVHHVGTAKGGIGHLCKEPVQTVSELMEEGGHLIVR